MANHTPGRMKAGGASVSVPETEDLPGLEAKLYGGNGQSKAANARRLSACWNACEGGLSTESLEQLAQIGGVPALTVNFSDLYKERDELLAALEELLTDMVIAQGNMRHAAKRDQSWEGCAEAIEPRCEAARALIAKVKGGAL